MSENVIITNEEKFNNLKETFKKEGVDRIHMLSDFDRTLTYCFVNGERRPSLISLLRDENYISDGYTKEAKELYNFYEKIEHDNSLPKEEKKKYMQGWWEKHFEVMKKYGFSKKHIDMIVNSGKIKIRDGVKDFLALTEKLNIPVIVISASGVGGEPIKKFLAKNGSLFSNLYIISNIIEFNGNGVMTGYKKPIITSWSKDETVLKEFPEIYNKIKERKNVILIGDELGDVGMIEGFDYDNLLKIGFLNEKFEERLPYYKKEFDVLITHDGDFSFINNFLKEIAYEK